MGGRGHHLLSEARGPRLGRPLEARRCDAWAWEVGLAALGEFWGRCCLCSGRGLCCGCTRACSGPRWAIVAQDSVQCTVLRQQSACCCLCCCFCCCCCCVQRSRRSVLILCAKVRTCCSLRVL